MFLYMCVEDNLSPQQTTAASLHPCYVFADFCCFFGVVSVIGLLSIVGFIWSWDPRALFLAESRFSACENREKLLLN